MSNFNEFFFVCVSCQKVLYKNCQHITHLIHQLTAEYITNLFVNLFLSIHLHTAWSSSWSSTVGRGCHRCISIIVWDRHTTRSGQASSQDLWSFLGVHQISQVCETASCTNQCLHCCVECFKGKVRDNLGKVTHHATGRVCVARLCGSVLVSWSKGCGFESRAVTNVLCP